MNSKTLTLSTLVDTLGLKAVCCEDKLDRPVHGGYASDLLSDVMAHAKKDNLWITLQIHPNVIAVAVLKEIAAIAFVNERQPTNETVTKAKTEGIPLLTSQLPAYELVGRLYELGLRGHR